MRRLFGTWEPSPAVRTEDLKRLIRKRQSRNTPGRGGTLRSSEEGVERRRSEGSVLSGPILAVNRETGRS